VFRAQAFRDFRRLLVRTSHVPYRMRIE
jgi:hypothetical protein